jgi:putative inorganic carbon (HCO3(-)) transporter
MDFAFFLLLTGLLFIRPADFNPELDGVPFYLIVAVVCLLLDVPRLVRLLSPRALAAQPATVCVLGVFAAAVGSHIARMALGEAFDTATEFSRVIAYYLLLITLLDTPLRLRRFLFWLLACILVLTSLAVLQYHGFIHIASFAEISERTFDPETGKFIAIRRLRGTGIFNDPNDISLLLLVGMSIALFWLANRRVGILYRILGLFPFGLFAYAFALTKSRGGFLALLAAVVTLFWYRYGRTRALLVSGLCLPVLLFLFAGRQTSYDLEDRESSGQARISLWSEGLEMFKENPILGIGYKQYAEEARQVAHNSYLHAYTELGVLGGTIFCGIVLILALSLRRVARARRAIRDPDLRRLQPFFMAAAIGYAVGLFSLSRCYVESTYLVFGLAVVYVRLAKTEPVLIPPVRLDFRLAFRMAVFGFLMLAGIDLCVRLFAQYS